MFPLEPRSPENNRKNNRSYFVMRLAWSGLVCRTTSIVRRHGRRRAVTAMVLHRCNSSSGCASDGLVRTACNPLVFGWKSQSSASKAPIPSDITRLVMFWIMLSSADSTILPPHGCGGSFDPKMALWMAAVVTSFDVGGVERDRKILLLRTTKLEPRPISGDA